MKIATQDDRRLRELDGFRGAAVLSIVLLHYVVHHALTTPGTLAAYSQKYLMFLWVGVDAFFVLSGFLIGGILLDHRESPNYFQVFYIRRVLRIVPPYLALLVSWLIARALLPADPYGWLLLPDFPAWVYFLYVQNYWMAAVGSVGPLFVAATWSLAIEEQFYLAAPLLIRWTRPRRIGIVLAAGILSAPALRGSLAFAGADWMGAQTQWLLTRCDSLLVGVGVAWAVRQPGLRARLVECRGRLLTLFWLLLAFVALLPILFEFPSSLRSPVKAFVGYFSIALLFGFMLVLFQIGALPRLKRILSVWWLVSLGRTSYFVYLFHTAVLGLVFAALLGKGPVLESGVDWLAMTAAFAITLALAELSWRWLESPLVKLGHRHAYKSRN